MARPGSRSDVTVRPVSIGVWTEDATVGEEGERLASSPAAQARVAAGLSTFRREQSADQRAEQPSRRRKVARRPSFEPCPPAKRRIGQRQPVKVMVSTVVGEDRGLRASSRWRSAHPWRLRAGPITRGRRLSASYPDVVRRLSRSNAPVTSRSSVLVVAVTCRTSGRSTQRAPIRPAADPSDQKTSRGRGQRCPDRGAAGPGDPEAEEDGTFASHVSATKDMAELQVARCVGRVRSPRSGRAAAVGSGPSRLSRRGPEGWLWPSCQNGIGRSSSRKRGLLDV